MNTINKHTLPIYIEQAKKCKANRIFIGGLGLIYSSNGRIHTMPDKIKEAIDYFLSAKRYMIVIEKVKPTLLQYPRPYAKITKKPL